MINQSWEDWKSELNQISRDYYGAKGAIGECGEEAWIKFFQEGLSPEEAFWEDMSNGI